MHRMRAWIDLALMSLTFFLTIIWNVEIGIAVSVVISLLLVVHRSSRTRLTILVSALPFPLSAFRRVRPGPWLTGYLLCGDAWMVQGRIPGTDKWKPIAENPEAEEDTSGVLIVRIRENLDFGECSLCAREALYQAFSARLALAGFADLRMTYFFGLVRDHSQHSAAQRCVTYLEIMSLRVLTIMGASVILCRFLPYRLSTSHRTALLSGVFYRTNDVQSGCDG